MNDTTFTRSPLFTRIAREDIAALVRTARPRSFRNGQILFHRGDEADGVYAIISGSICVFTEIAVGSEAVIAVRGAGDVLGEMALLDGAPRSTSARADGHTETAWVSRADFEAWLATHPAASRAMLAQLAGRLREATDQVAEMTLLDVETRLARRLWLEFKRTAAGDPSPGARLALSQGQIASLLGVTRESVNKQLAKLRARGAVTTDAGAIVLVDAEILRTIADAL